MSGVEGGSQVAKRFYKAVEVCDLGQSGFGIRLDGRPVKTPQRSELSVGVCALAQDLASEWRAQKDTIDPQTMPLTKLVNTAIDGVRGRESDVVDHIIEYVANDLICYRASHPPELIERQKASWDPVLSWAESEFGIRFVLAEGVMPVEQPAASIAAFQKAFAAYEFMPLSALHVVTTLTGSAILALALARGKYNLDEVWVAAHIDEDFQISQWGEDAEALARRKRRFDEINAAWRVLSLLQT